jgi:hypothetical protein
LKFSYTGLDGKEHEGIFEDLEVVYEGPIPIGEGWSLDRINLSKSMGRYIEFRSGPEGPHGIVASIAVEVPADYVQRLGLR